MRQLQEDLRNERAEKAGIIEERNTIKKEKDEVCECYTDLLV